MDATEPKSWCVDTVFLTNDNNIDITSTYVWGVVCLVELNNFIAITQTPTKIEICIPVLH